MRFRQDSGHVLYGSIWRQLVLDLIDNMSLEWSDHMKESNIFLVGGIALFKEKERNSVSEHEKMCVKSGRVSRILSPISSKGDRDRSLIWDEPCGSPQATDPGVVTDRADPLCSDLSVIASAPLCGLAPGGVCQARPVTRPAGELLPHRFTLTCDSERLHALNHVGGLLSAALSLPLRAVGVTHHHALRSPDFPPGHNSPAIGQPTLHTNLS